MSSIDHLHAETQVLPVRDHLSSQFLARALQPSHPSYNIVTTPPDPRNLKHTLQSRFFPDVAPYTVGGIIHHTHYKPTIKSLHTDAVTRAIAT